MGIITSEIGFLRPDEGVRLFITTTINIIGKTALFGP
jgi:hypothetical protein